MSDDQPVLEARGIVKSFGRVEALRGANFSVHAGEVVALVGDNGAGKSTLVEVLAGVHPADSSEILFEDRPVTLQTPQQARDIGIETVYQDLALAAEIDSQGVEQAYNALTGKPTTAKIGTESTSITKDNLADNQDALYKPSC